MVNPESPFSITNHNYKPAEKLSRYNIEVIQPKEDHYSNDMSTEEILQLQNNIIEDQDGQLDQLFNIITRQKDIGLAIGTELDLQADLLQETDERLGNTHNRMNRATQNLGKIFNSDESRGIYLCFNDYFKLESSYVV